ncbi:MAG: CoA transferase [Clostridiales Family XIII bacterium]|jgi:CoA:oxalate CoA-transferase|nr:CoA transferase [Clostridiales Family XIII bacterium]
MGGILDGVTVLDLTRVLSGPYATMLLADMGADVIKVEKPVTGDDSRSFGPFVNGESVYFMSVNRNKRSVSIDLKTDEGKALLMALAEKADVIVENFRPGTMDRLGLGYDRLREKNERLIYAAISGFGQSGPYSERAAYDGIVQAMGGIMSITGEKGGRPLRVGSSIGDIIAGINCSCGILAALVNREKTGKGALVDIAMLDSIVAILENAIARYQVAEKDPAPDGNTHQSIFPFETFPTASQDDIMIAAGNDSLWARLCEAIGRPGLAEDARLSTNPLRGENHSYMYEQLSDALSAKTAEEWYDILTAVGVPSSPINRISQVIENPQVQARGMIQSFEHPRAGKVTVAGNPIKIGGDGAAEYGYSPAPMLGADTLAVLRDILGYDDNEIGALSRAGAISCNQ